MIDWLSKVAIKMDEKTFVFGIIIMWSIWNAILINGENRTAQGTLRSAENYCREIANLQFQTGTSTTGIVQKWIAPPTGFVKNNFDGSVNTERRRGGIGIVARDSNGRLLGYHNEVLEGIRDPQAAEFIAATRAMEWSLEQGSMSVHVEGDALNVINSINKGNVDFSAMGNLIQEARVIKSLFQVCKLMHIRRDGNKAAHALAKESAFNCQSLFFFSVC